MPKRELIAPSATNWLEKQEEYAQLMYLSRLGPLACYESEWTSETVYFFFFLIFR
jgi:hypothetical protein